VIKSTLNKGMHIWNNHPFHYHIAASFLLVFTGILICLGLYIHFEMQSLLVGETQVNNITIRDVEVRLIIALSTALAVSIPFSWMMALRISSQLNILKKQATAIREFDFTTEFPLNTPIREIFGLSRAMRQMKDTIQKFMRVTIALSGERDFDKLLGKVLHEMREILDGDGGIIYLYDEDNHLLQQTSQRWAKNGNPVPTDWQDIKLSDTNHPISSVVSNSHKTSIHTINFPRPQGMDALNERYNEDSVLVVTVPLRASDSSLIGIVCNFLATGKSEPSAERITLAESFSSTAAVAIDQRRLVEAQEKLLDSMIKIIAGAIDTKSPYTGGHCERVPVLSMMLAKEACKVNTGTLAEFAFKTDEEWREFRIGSWLHDCGKVTTPEHIVDKATKLEMIYNRIHEVRVRFEVLLRDAKIIQLEAITAGTDPKQALRNYEDSKLRLTDDFEFIAECNLGGEFMALDKVERLEEIAGYHWQRNFDDRIGISHEESKHYNSQPKTLPVTENLLADKEQHIIPRSDTRIFDPKWGFKIDVPENLYNHGEVCNLSIGRGTLTEEERFKINEHVMHSLIMLEQLPLPKNLRRVPEYAGTHHETLTGSGYPRKLTSEQMTVPMRIMAIADIFEALTACDRPYKKAKTLSEAIKILSFFKKDSHIDSELFDLFLSTGVYKKYADQYLLPDQMDEVEIEQYMG
jgi:HD-GYP domain-containing protein (c-di-GMP phosphodiesterase class II)